MITLVSWMASNSQQLVITSRCVRGMSHRKTARGDVDPRVTVLGSRP